MKILDRLHGCKYYFNYLAKSNILGLLWDIVVVGNYEWAFMIIWVEVLSDYREFLNLWE
jgi:hypothetical protein